MSYNQEMKNKLQRIIDEGKNNVHVALMAIQNEFASRKDMIVKPQAIDFNINDNGIRPIIGDTTFSLTNHSSGQLLAKSNIPKVYSDKLIELKEFGLLKTNLNTMLNRTSEDGMLIRRVDGLIKGILSPSYRRIDGSPILESFVQSALNSRFVPYMGMNTDFRMQLRFILPEMFEITKDEFVVYGMALTTGDYGSSAMNLETFILRIWCKNLALGQSMLRKVHIGKRFEATDDVTHLFSDKTHALDAATVASAVSDTVATSTEHIKYLAEIAKNSTEKELDVNVAIEKLRKQGMTKMVADKVKSVYSTEAPIELLPQEKNAWRLSNAISLIAKSDGLSSDQMIDLEKQAFTVMTPEFVTA